MKINQDTKKCISIAENPGSSGLEFHNKGYEFLRLNWIYLPLKVLPNQLEQTMQLIRDNFEGCGVSMPHKIKVLDLLNDLDETAVNTMAVNTVKKQADRSLKGYNTDAYGAEYAIKNSLDSLEGKEVLLIGSGGAARAIGYMVKKNGGNLSITGRTNQSTKNLAKKLNAKLIPWVERANSKGYLLINATSVGLRNTWESISSPEEISNFKAVMDVVVYSKGNNTKLISDARAQGKIIIPGRNMSIYQAAKQFEIYTDEKLPSEFINQFLEDSK